MAKIIFQSWFLWLTCYIHWQLKSQMVSLLGLWNSLPDSFRGDVYAPFRQCCWIQAQLPHFQGCVCCLWLAFPFISMCHVARLWSYSLFICSFISYVSILKKSSFLAEENNFSTSTIAVHKPWHDRYPALPEYIFVLVYMLKYIWKDE